MNRRTLLSLAAPALAVAALLSFAESGRAQFSFSMGRGGFGGRGWTFSYGPGYSTYWPRSFYRSGYYTPGFYYGPSYARSYYYNPGFSTFDRVYTYYSTPRYYSVSPRYSTYSAYPSQGPGMTWSGSTSAYPSADQSAGARQSFYGSPQTVSATFVMPGSDAELWVEGQKMDSTGTRREFVSPPLDPNKRFTYTFKARWQENGRPVERTKEMVVYAGDRLTVDFTTPDTTIRELPRGDRAPRDRDN